MRTIRFRILLIRNFIKSTSLLLNAALLGCLVLYTNLSGAQEVKMYAGCNVVLTGNIYLVVNNTAFKNDGTFVAGSSTVKFVGSNDTTIAHIDGNSNTTFNNLMLTKTAFGIAIKSSVGVKNVLTVSAGRLYNNSNLTLLSDVDNTARLDVVPAGGFIYGTAMVERYIPSKRAWRLMTAPVTNSASIYNSWQNGGVYTPGKGLLISGPGASTGMDNGNAYSLKKWNPPAQSFIPVTNTFASISPTNNGSGDNTGYFVFVRGDRNPANFNIANTNITTLTSIGSLQTGLQTYTAAGTAGGFTLIGNPYASPIDFDLVSRTNLLKRFYVWDPNLNALGAYVTMDDLDNDGIYSKSVAASAQTKEIQSSQAFFVETSSNGTASLSINENAKSTNNASYVFRTVRVNPVAGQKASLRANIYLRSSETAVVLADGALLEFGAGFTKNVTNEDALKFANINETIGFQRYATTMAIERRPMPGTNDTLFINLQRITQRNYQLQLVPEHLDQPGLTAYLEDSYLHTSKQVNLSSSDATDFSVDANPASAVAGRFKIIFKQLVVLHIPTLVATAYDLDKNIKIGWKAKGDTGNIKYAVEKSSDGTAFTAVNITEANITGDYSWLDVSPLEGKNSYRVKSINSNGVINYSDVVYVQKEGRAGSFTISPNPVKGSRIHLQFRNQPHGNYHFNLINSGGLIVHSTLENISNSSTRLELKINTALPAGLYQLQIAGPAGKNEIQQVVIQQ
ncbi:MAG: hypothetical protein WKI04_13710 [Ferruginibacter sp.]